MDHVRVVMGQMGHVGLGQLNGLNMLHLDLNGSNK
jgi:hypothetical protein